MAQQNEHFGNSEQLAQQKLVNSKHLESSSAKNAQVETAVDWFYDQITRTYWDFMTTERQNELFEQAKEMEKQQREELALEYFKAGQDSMEEGGKSFDQYYTQTYGK